MVGSVMENRIRSFRGWDGMGGEEGDGCEGEERCCLGWVCGLIWQCFSWAVVGDGERIEVLGWCAARKERIGMILLLPRV